MAQTEKLRWQAIDAEDLVVISSAIQDGVVQVGEIKFDKRARSLTLVFNRFRWELSDYGKGQRVAAALRIDSVLNVQGRGINRADPSAVTVMLSAEFVPDADPPGGTLTLTFAGEGELRAQVECIDVALVDISPSRSNRQRPDHDLEIAD